MKGKRYTTQGKYWSLFKTTIGFGGVVASEDGLLEVLLPFAGKCRDELVVWINSLYPLIAMENQVTRNAALLLEKYFAGEKVSFGLPICWLSFTPFMSAVYEAVRDIPYGSVQSYGEVASKIGHPRSARGVGAAMANNPLPIIIPCHRVVGASGGLIGYSAPGGIMSKKWLLLLEGLAVTGTRCNQQEVG
jgi:methylated-DNA-[protein]-cysteine S-methyltransferase